jgi:hypothetical protein
MGFIHLDEDFTVIKVGYKPRLRFGNSGKDNNVEKFHLDTVSTLSGDVYKVDNPGCDVPDEIAVVEKEADFEELYNPVSGHSEVEYVEIEGLQRCWEGSDDEFEVYKKVRYDIDFNYCEPSVEFEVTEKRLMLEYVETENISSFRLFIDDEEIIVEDSDVAFVEGDIVRVEVDISDKRYEGVIKFTCYNPYEIVEN